MGQGNVSPKCPVVFMVEGAEPSFLTELFDVARERGRKVFFIICLVCAPAQKCVTQAVSTGQNPRTNFPAFALCSLVIKYGSVL